LCDRKPQCAGGGCVGNQMGKSERRQTRQADFLTASVISLDD
jgi:hypothetical protein